MSWLKENYEKAALGGAAVIALGAGAMILTSDAGEVTEEQNPARVNTFDVPESVALGEYEKALAKTGVVDRPQHLETDVNSFIAFPIYGVKGNDKITELGPDTLFHGIPLSWWKEHGIEDYKFSGADELDKDEDGFTNKEEFDGKTIPTDLASRPDLIVKLQLVDSKKTSYRIQWSKVDDDRASMSFTLNRRNTSDISGVGDTFPKNVHPEDFLNRFKVKAKGTGQNPTTNSEEEFYEIEDTKKPGVVLKMWRSDGPKSFNDWSAQFKLNTPDGGDAFVVPEGGSFSLPYKEGGKGYTFKFVPNRDPRLKELPSIDIEGPNGVVQLGLAPQQAEEPKEDEAPEGGAPAEAQPEEGAL